jgi:hypothetical protein
MNGPNIPRSEIRAGLNKYWANVRARAAKNGISEKNAEQKLENEYMAAYEARKKIAIQARNNAARARAKQGGRRTRRRRTRRRHTRR